MIAPGSASYQATQRRLPTSTISNPLGVWARSILNVRVIPEFVGLEAVAGDASLVERGGQADFFSDWEDACFNGP